MKKLWLTYLFMMVATTALMAQQSNCSLISANQPATSSSHEGDYVASRVNDGDTNSRWSSEFSDDQWLRIDLGGSYSICEVKMNWEAAYGKKYEIRLGSSTNLNESVVIATVNNGNGGVETITTNSSPSGQYVWMRGLERGTGYGYSLWEMEVYGRQAGGCDLISANKPAIASGYEGDYIASRVTDGDLNSRWSSEFNDNQWVRIDLGGTYSVCEVKLNWEAAYASKYNIRLGSSEDLNSSQVIATVNNGMGGVEVISTNQNQTGRYIWMQGVERATGYGYSLWEMEVYGRLSSGGDNGNNDPNPPITGVTAPRNVSASAIKYAVTISWQHASSAHGIKEYRVYEGSVQRDLASGNNSSLTISGLAPETDYRFCVVAVDNNNNLSEPACVNFRTQSDQVGDDTNVYDGVGNIALGTITEHSSIGGGGTSGSAFAVDGIMSSRWESAFNDNEWLIVDLGLRYRIGRYIIHWETASGKHYKIQVSDDKQNWEDAYVFNQNNLPVEPRVDDYSFPEKIGRYVRFLGVERNTSWSYSIFEFELYSPGSGPDDIIDVNPCPNPQPILPQDPSFSANSPHQGAMITNTRRPTLQWDNVGAQRYEVWVNITRDDYDWYACGSLLDRFTKVGETTSNSYTFSQDLPDRWTYKWYIKAIHGGSESYSSIGQFSVYLPILEQWDDGVNIVNGCRDLNKNGTIEPYEDWRNPIHIRVEDLMSRMTLEEKAYQMFYNAQAFPQSGWAFGPGTVHDMFDKQKASARTRLGIPFVSAGDCIHGYSTTYPTQSAMAASRNLDIVYKVGNMQRVEQVGVGFRGSLSPIAEVGTKVLYPRIQEGCGEDAEFAAAMIRALVSGMQGGPELNPSSVMVTTKHWPGQGAGGEANVTYDAVSVKYHMRPWFANLDAGAGSIMPGYAGSNFLDPAGKGAGNSKPTLDYLRDVVGFHGAICTDWLPWGAWADAALAGADIMGGADPGAPGFSMASFINEVGEDRINDAVRKILDIKFRLGVFEDPYGDPDLGQQNWFTPEHENLVIDAARQSMTLLENNGVLPLNLPAGSNLLVTGSRANDGSSYSIWTSYFHEQYGAKTMYEAIAEKGRSRGINVSLDHASNPAAAIVIVGEPSYTHATSWDNEKPYFHDAYFPISGKNEYDLTTLEQVKAMGIPYVVVVIMPRPYILTDIVNSADATLIAYRPGDGGGPALAQVLFGEYSPKGRLPWQLPRSMEQIGTDKIGDQQERWDLPFDLGATMAERQEIKRLITEGIQPQPIYGDPLYQYGYGIQGYVKGEDNGGTTQPEPSTGVATFYSECNYGGKAVGLNVGSYNLSDLEYRGISNDDISAIKVSAGYKVVAYWDNNFSGASKEFSSNISCLADVGWDNAISSLKVEVASSTGATIRIEAEDYVSMSGVDTEVCSEGGLNVGWIDTGDWMVWDINIPTTGEYTVSYRVSSPYSTGKIQLEKSGGSPVYGTIDVPNTGGWQNWQTISHTVQLTAGTQQIVINVREGGYNLNWIEVAAEAGLKSLLGDEGDGEMSKQMTISPIPARTELMVSGYDAGSVIKIYNLQGILMVESVNSLVNVSGLQPGVYFLLAEVNGKVQQVKFVKE